jgi:hypothetical protein
MFKSGKIKISGGLGKLECDENMNDDEFQGFLKKVIIIPSLELGFGVLPEYNLDKKIINANMKRTDEIGKTNYMNFINEITHQFGLQYVSLPEIMKENGKKRGRICAVKVKNKKGQGSFAVDHSGNVQFFAYNNIEDLRDHITELKIVWL